jgi:hypothetical protein
MAFGLILYHPEGALWTLFKKAGASLDHLDRQPRFSSTHNSREKEISGTGDPMGRTRIVASVSQWIDLEERISNAL